MCVFSNNRVKEVHKNILYRDAITAYREYATAANGMLLSPYRGNRVPPNRKIANVDPPAVTALGYIMRHGFYAYKKQRDCNRRGSVLVEVKLYGGVVEFAETNGYAGGFIAQKVEVVRVVKIHGTKLRKQMILSRLSRAYPRLEIANAARV